MTQATATKAQTVKKAPVAKAAAAKKSTTAKPVPAKKAPGKPATRFAGGSVHVTGRATPSKTTKPSTALAKTVRIPNDKSPRAKAQVAAAKEKATRSQFTDEQIIATCERLWTEGQTTAWAMYDAARKTGESCAWQRFIVHAKAVVAGHGGSIRKNAAKATQKASGSLDTLEVMKQEDAALKAWKASGSKGTRPETPTLDARNAEIAKRDAKAKAEADAFKKAKAQRGAAAA